ncbi:MAG: hypothetical protein AAGJ08_03285 [Cyanobacteria bacterium P01_H01_bin.35]
MDKRILLEQEHKATATKFFLASRGLSSNCARNPVKVFVIAVPIKPL